MPDSQRFVTPPAPEAVLNIGGCSLDRAVGIRSDACASFIFATHPPVCWRSAAGLRLICYGGEYEQSVMACLFPGGNRQASQCSSLQSLRSTLIAHDSKLICGGLMNLFIGGHELRGHRVPWRGRVLLLSRADAVLAYDLSSC